MKVRGIRAVPAAGATAVPELCAGFCGRASSKCGSGVPPGEPSLGSKDRAVAKGRWGDQEGNCSQPSLTLQREVNSHDPKLTFETRESHRLCNPREAQGANEILIFQKLLGHSPNGVSEACKVQGHT